MNVNNTQWLKKLSELEAQYCTPKTSNRELVKEAFSICTEHSLPLPEWVLYGITPLIHNPQA